MFNVLMKCGHAANAKTATNRPACAICGCLEIAEEQPNLIGRKAKCFYCGKKTDSSLDLPFFEYCADKKEDEYYCGCMGWD